MKKLFSALLLTITTCFAFATPSDVDSSLYFRQTDGLTDRILTITYPDDGVPCLYSMQGLGGGFGLPGISLDCITLGTNLSRSANVLNSAVFNFGTPTNRTLSVSTSYQALSPTKASVITVSPQCTAALSLTGGATCTMQARINTSTATCSNGVVVAQWTNGNTGTLTIGLALNQVMGAPASLQLPIGSYFILCPTSGTFTINNITDQSAG